MSDKDRIAELEAENSTLRARLAQFGVGLAADDDDLPNEHELDLLLGMVTAAWPRLTVAASDMPRHRAGILDSLRFLRFAQRCDRLDDHDVEHFAGRAETFAAQAGRYCRVSEQAFYVAAIIAGVAFSAPSHWPHGIRVGLLAFGSHSRPIPLAWRSILADRKLPAPLPLPGRAAA
jgi:hypothetical protein